MINEFESLELMYKQILKRNDTRFDLTECEKKEKMYENIKSLSQDDLYEIFDTGVFNRVMLAYVEKALMDVEMSEGDNESVVDSLLSAFDMFSAKDIM